MQTTDTLEKTLMLGGIGAGGEGITEVELAVGIRWPKYWSFSMSLSNEYSEQVSFRIDWFDLLAVQGALKSLL